MFLRALTTLAIAACALASISISDGDSVTNYTMCGTDITSDQKSAVEQRLSEKLKSVNVNASGPAAPPRNFDVYWNVIYEDVSLAGGYLPDSAIQEQMTVLNDAYRHAGFTFSLKNTTRFYQPTWFNQATYSTAAQDDMKSALHKGGNATLNIYSAAMTAIPPGERDPLFGYATFPLDYSVNPSWQDGIVMNFRTIPFNDPLNFGPAYGTGKITVHEVGHWLGLYHVFQDENCYAAGDLVADTPQQSTASSGCPVGKDSCPWIPGYDSINNHMDYSDDTCRDSFTDGQVIRMNQLVAAFRT